MSMPISSAAMSAIEARLPPMSGLPVSTEADPSSLMCTVALELPPKLNQKPLATPLPWLGPSSIEYCGWSRTASTVSRKPIRLWIGP